MTCPSKFRPSNVIGYRAGDLEHEEIQRRENYQGPTGGGKLHYGPGNLPETQDHRTEFVSLAEQIRSMTVLEVWRLKELEQGVGTHYIDLGSPWQNPFIENFSSIFRTTFVIRWCFLILAETKALTR